MKNASYFLVATNSILIGLTCVISSPVRAAIFSRSFSVQIQEGIYSGQEFQGSFRYDDERVYELGSWTGFELTDFSLDFPGFSELIPGSFPNGIFENLLTFSVPAWNETTQSLALFYAPGPALNGENDAFSLFDDRFMYGETTWLGNQFRINGSGTVTYSEAVNTSVPEPGSTAALFSFLGFAAIGLAKRQMS